MVGLGNADNTTDLLKPVSAAQQTALDLKATIASPTFTGTVSAPTPTNGTNTTQVATTAFVQSGLSLKANTASPTISNPTLTGTVFAPTPITGTNNTQVATTEFVNNTLDTKANTSSPTISNPTFTGTVIAPTPSSTTNNTQIATTAFVKTAINDLIGGASPALDTLFELSQALGDDSNFASTVTTSLSEKAPLDSPAFIGSVTAPTVVSTANNTQVATTAFVKTSILTKANINNQTFTGTVSAPTPASGTSNTQIATTEFVTLIANQKASLDSPTFTGSVIAPTPSSSANNTEVATTAFVKTSINNLIDGSPAALNTLNELSKALGDDASFATTVTNSLSQKAPLESPTFSGTTTISSLVFPLITTLPLSPINGQVVIHKEQSGLSYTYTMKIYDTNGWYNLQ
jgi:hypothetical protein